jgi:hypothetical protein
MGRKSASPSTDRKVAATDRHRGDPRQVRAQVAQRRARVADIAKVRHRGCRPTTTEVRNDCPDVIDDFSQPIPVLERELDAIEMYLGPLLDKLLQRME